MTHDSESIHAHSNGDRVEVQASKTYGQATHAVSLDFAKEDAPAVALAILEAAGIRGMASDDSDADIAVGHLRRHVGLRKDKAEREAEDAKADDFRKSFDPHNPFEWKELAEDAKALWRDRYNAARKFFEES